MIPNISGILNDTIQIQESPTRTFKLDANKGFVIGFVDAQEAMKQAIYMILNTERFDHLIYSWDYGVELGDLFGKPRSFVLPELKRKITEALTQDTRITSVEDFTFAISKQTVTAAFTVKTIYGAINAEMAVVI